MRIGNTTLAGTCAAFLSLAAWALPPTPPGALDPTFTGNGLLTTQFTGSLEGARAALGT